MLAALGFIGVAIYTFLSVQPLTTLVKDMVPKAITLVNSAAVSSLGGDIMSAVNVSVLEAVRNYVAYLDFAAMGPALISMMMLLISSLISCFSSDGYCCSKVFIFFSDLILLLTFAYYVVIAGLGVLHDRPVLTDRWNDITDICLTSRPQLAAAVTEAQAAVDMSSGFAPGTLGTLEATLGEATQALTFFDGLCADLVAVPGRLQQLTGPGLVGLGLTIIAYILVNGMCCATGCCGSANPAGKPAKRTSVAPQDDDDDDDDELIGR